MGTQMLSRRDRYRTATREEAKGIALRQLAEGGTGALSLNAIGKEMGITGPALYRYFASRDALLTELITDAYGDFAAAVETVVQAGDNAAYLRALAAAVRAWALAQPHRYLLLYGTPVSGYVAPEGTVPLASRILAPFLAALAVLPSPANATDSPVAMLDAQFTAAVAQDPDHQIPGALMRRGVVWWTRMHGLLSLEIEGHFAGMSFDPALLYDVEVAALLADGGTADRATVNGADAVRSS